MSVVTFNGTRRVAIIGMGLMGGSLGLALRCFTSDFEVVGFDRDAETLSLAYELGACDEIAASVANVARGADIIVVAVPIGELEAVFSEIAATGLDENVTVTDLCSVKRLPVRLGQRLLGPRFVGGHPMAGSEKSGVIASNADLLPRATWFLTPTAGTSESALAEVARLVRSIGARTVLTGPEAHDRIVASVSHLPYVVSVALLHSVLRNRGSAALGIAGRSLRDMTRVAASKPDFWMPVLEANRNEVVDSLDGLIVVLSSLREAIARGAREELFPYLEEAQELRAVAARSHHRSPPGWSRERESPPASQLPAPFPAEGMSPSTALGDGSSRGKAAQSSYAGARARGGEARHDARGRLPAGADVIEGCRCGQEPLFLDSASRTVSAEVNRRCSEFRCCVIDFSTHHEP